MKQIFLAEDDAMIASALCYALGQEGYAPTHCATVAAATAALQATRFDLALLDLQLPDGSGTALAQALQNTPTAVIFLTVVDDEGQIVRAFEQGAADYIVKPFRLRELLARIKRTLQTAPAAPGGKPAPLTVGGVTIEPVAGKVYVGAPPRPVELTALEYRLLLVFAANPGALLTRRRILESIWDCGGNFVEDNTLTVYVKRLREKLGDALPIETVRGLGYRVGK